MGYIRQTLTRRTWVGLGLLLLVAQTPVTAPAAAPTQQMSQPACVILLHGLARSRRSMAKLARALSSQGYTTVNYAYPSRQYSIEKLASDYIQPAVAQCGADWSSPIHFVTHSLGGIIVRQYLQTHTLPKGSRMVMLSPPNQGSEVADKLRHFWFYKWFMGPSGQQLGTRDPSVLKRLKPVPIEVGVITGNKSLNPWFSSLLPGADDGKVAVERARLAEMRDFLVVPRSHAFIMRHSIVIQQVIYFLQHGRFAR